MKLYPFKLFRNGNLCSEHLSRKAAEKMASRLLAMSKGRLTAADFEIVDLTVSAALAARKLMQPAVAAPQLEFRWGRVSANTSNCSETER